VVQASFVVEESAFEADAGLGWSTCPPHSLEGRRCLSSWAVRGPHPVVCPGSAGHLQGFLIELQALRFPVEPSGGSTQ